MPFSLNVFHLFTLHRIRRKRPSLRLIVSSATLDAGSFLDFFNSDTGDAGSGSDPSHKPEATIISLEGRMYPVEVAYLAESTPDYVREAVRTVWGIHMQVRFSLVQAALWLSSNSKEVQAISLCFSPGETRSIVVFRNLQICCPSKRPSL